MTNKQTHLHATAYLLLLLGTLLSGLTNANTPKPSSITSQLFDIDYFELDNHIPVIMHKRANNDLFSVHLVANVGLRDFPCVDRQLAHVTEHVLFEGTESLNGKELRKRVYDKGGYWEGFTTEEYTHYTINVHRHHADIAVDTLYRMISEPALTANATNNAIRIVNSEMGTTSSSLHQFFSDTLTIAEQGKNRLYPSTNLACEKRHIPNHLTVNDVTQAFNDYYVPENFTLMVLGEFDKNAILKQLNNTIGAIPNRPAAPKTPFDLNPINYEPITERNKYGDPTTYVKMYVRADGKGSSSQHAWELISLYLSEKMFDEIRTKRGIGYTPRVTYEAGSELGHLAMEVRTISKWHQEVIRLALDIFKQLKTDGIPEKEVERFKQRMILKFEAKERKNKRVFQLYRHNAQWIKQHRGMRNLLDEMAALTVKDIEATIQKIPDTPVVAVLRPHALWEIALKVLGIVALAALIAIPIHKLLRRKKVRDD